LSNKYSFGKLNEAMNALVFSKKGWYKETLAILTKQGRKELLIDV
jgi:hypothetical protein